jgi:hypothetical protein
MAPRNEITLALLLIPADRHTSGRSKDRRSVADRPPQPDEVVSQLAHGEIVAERPPVENEHTIGDAPHLHHHVRRHEHGAAGVSMSGQGAHEVVACARVQHRRHLVEQEDVGMARQRGGARDLHLLTPRQRREARVQIEAKGLGDLAKRFPPESIVPARVGTEELPHRHGDGVVGGLADVGDGAAVLRIVVVKRAPEHRPRPPICHLPPGEDAHQRRLPRAVPTHEGVERAPRERE